MGSDKKNKPMRQDVEAVFKYGGISGTLSAAFIGILLHFFSSLEPIDVYLATLLTFVLNMGLMLLARRFDY